MIRRVLRIGRWIVDFLFAPRGYDIDGILACLYDCGATNRILSRAEDLMNGCDMESASDEGLMYDCGYNQGFTYSNSRIKRMVVVIGPTTSGEEFIDTLVHEVHHMAVAIAQSLDIPLDSEPPAYLSGDAARELADVICELGCPSCHR